ncbi:transcriptional regulator [Oceanicola granulosus HTCC2516]|uniref:Transcriptional regulator n=1 Tax=Oceanicola granulosus (strain ATCC BAA-861 / DSM 15982 / KCTC 12143 / HTCC2516) TaxID=314256 RepID=Q2CEI7_OCEGH|nr:LysR family transcriptional regulator [Oceanicola granulosus]EAR51145.1 transcriptional regulator [Oceanicola granulosus HTCC2516]
MIDLMTHLFRLQAIVEEGSMRRAALHLNLTQPALTRSVQLIEERLGQPLLERHARGVEPTAFGREVLSSVMRLSRQWELAEQELLAATTSAKRVLRLEAGPLWRMVVLPAILGPLKEKHPDLRIELTNLRPAESSKNVIEGKIDVLCGGLQFVADLPPTMQHRAFTHFHDRVTARADHPLFARIPKSGQLPPEVLLDYPWLVYTGDPIYELETAHAATERLGREPDVRISCESLASALRVLQQSNCVSILPDGALADLSGPPLVPVPVSLGRRRAPSGVIFREEMLDWPPLTDLLSACEEFFGTRGYVLDGTAPTQPDTAEATP